MNIVPSSCNTTQKLTFMRALSYLSVQNTFSGKGSADLEKYITMNARNVFVARSACGVCCQICTRKSSGIHE